MVQRRPRNSQLLDQAPRNATDPDQIRYDFHSVVTELNGIPTLLTVGGGRETFDFAGPENSTRVDDDVWAFSAPSNRAAAQVGPGRAVRWRGAVGSVDPSGCVRAR